MEPFRLFVEDARKVALLAKDRDMPLVGASGGAMPVFTEDEVSFGQLGGGESIVIRRDLSLSDEKTPYQRELGLSSDKEFFRARGYLYESVKLRSIFFAEVSMAIFLAYKRRFPGAVSVASDYGPTGLDGALRLYAKALGVGALSDVISCLARGTDFEMKLSAQATRVRCWLSDG